MSWWWGGVGPVAEVPLGAVTGVVCGVASHLYLDVLYHSDVALNMAD